jgi:hypothetical protein
MRFNSPGIDSSAIISDGRFLSRIELLFTAVAAPCTLTRVEAFNRLCE